MWKSLFAGFVFQHPSIAALRCELLRNGQLQDLCGFDPCADAAAVPSEYAYTRSSAGRASIIKGRWRSCSTLP